MPEHRRFTVDDLLCEARSGLTRLSPLQAQKAVQGGALIVDIRQDTDRQAAGVVGGSIHIPLTVLEWAVDPDFGMPNPAIAGFDHHLIVMCNQGFASSLAAHNLQRLGFARATDLEGGFVAWCDAGLPVQAPSARDARTLPGRCPPEPLRASGSVPEQPGPRSGR